MDEIGGEGNTEEGVGGEHPLGIAMHGRDRGGGEHRGGGGG